MDCNYQVAGKTFADFWYKKETVRNPYTVRI